jgi:RND family efflux transporter MFP subunit
MRTAGIGLALSILSIVVIGCSNTAPPPPTPTAVKVATVERAGALSSTRYSAQIEPQTSVELAFKVGGYVDVIAKAPGVDGKPRILQEGDAVHVGSELAVIRRTDYMQKLGEASASFAQAKSAAEQAQLDFDRSTKLVANGSVSASELDSARIRRDGANASMAGAKVRIDEAQTALADTSLRSPLDGVVVKRSIETGALAAPGTVGFIVAVTDSVKAVFGVPDTVLPRVQLGAVQAVTTEAYASVEFQGRITRIAPTADAKSRVFEVEVTIPNADQRLKSGMVAALSLAQNGTAQTQDVPLVPLAAIVRSPVKQGEKSDGKSFAVFIVDDKHVAHAKDVELGEYLGRVIPVTQGLSGGEQIVVQGAGLLSDGESVEIIP